ncbi:hypothetical protein Q9233_009692 [Columba guinea]|nr:hypothetical protein Q9233_009692 [Columba guinea]
MTEEVLVLEMKYFMAPYKILVLLQVAVVQVIWLVVCKSLLEGVQWFFKLTIC